MYINSKIYGHCFAGYDNHLLTSDFYVQVNLLGIGAN